jgi:nucleoside phosphorylase
MTEKFDIAVVCALAAPELQALLRTGDKGWSERPSSNNDPSSYNETTYTTTWGQQVRVVAAAPTQMGMAASAVVTTKMIRRFSPDMVAMVGICAGVDRGSQGFGDIVAPDRTFDHGSGKIEDEGKVLRFVPDPQPLEIDPVLADRIASWKREDRRLADIRREWQAKPADKALQLHRGAMGSGAAVLAARTPVRQLQEHWRKLSAIDMEAYGVHLACKHAARRAPIFLCLKSICDFADPDKDDDWQAYAAYTAASLFHDFVIEEWEALVSPEQYPQGNFKTWDSGIRTKGRLEKGSLRMTLRNDFAGIPNESGLWLHNEVGFDASAYRRLGIELRVIKGLNHRIQIKLETRDGKNKFTIFHASLGTFGRENEWLKAGVDLGPCDRNILEKIGRVVFAVDATDLPHGKEVELEIRRIVFLR